MQKVKTSQFKSRTTAIAISFVFVLFSALILLTSLISPLIAINVTAADAKTNGDKWQTFVDDYATNHKDDGLQVVSVQDIYSEIFKNCVGTAFNPGVITPKTQGGTDAKYKNKNGATEYNYCLTIQNASDLNAFSYLTYGRKYAAPNESPVVDVANFFRASNVKLANNIDYNGNGDFIIKGATDTNIKLQSGHSGKAGEYGSNGVYIGYGTDNDIVKYPFMPIAGFSGVFDGQNFDIQNLAILQNATINTTDYDAFFASIVTGGVVKNFGLSKPIFLKVDGLSDPATEKPKNNTIAGICGSNAGTVEYVYNTGAEFSGGANTTTIATIANTGTAPNIGTATEYYTGESKKYSSLKRVIGANNVATIERSENPTTINGDTTFPQPPTTPPTSSRWYSSAKGDRFSNWFHDNCQQSYRLNGLAKKADVTGEQNYEIRTIADFVTFMHVFKEGFSIVGSPTAIKGNVYVEITNDLDFKYVGKNSLIPAIDFSSNATNVTLYSGVKTNDINGSTIAPITDFTARKTLTNMPLDTYIDYGNTFTSYGIFSSLSAGYPATAIAVYNFNFINCNINIGEEVTTTDAKTTNAGLIAGYLKRPFDVSCVGSNSNIKATDGQTTGASNRIGGLIGALDNSNTGTNGNGRFNNVCVSGELYSGYRNYNCNNSASIVRYSTGGLIGFNDSANADSAAEAVRYSEISVMGKITGFMPATKTGVEAISCTGGIIGYGTLIKSSVLANSLQGVYMGATVNSAPTANLTYNHNYTANVGGFAGELIASTDKTSYETYIDGGDATSTAIAVQMAGNVVAVKATPSQANQTINIGGFAGVAGSGTIENLTTSNFFATSASGGGTLSVSGGSGAGKGTILHYGNIYGNATNGSLLTKVINKTPITLTGDFSSVNVGGLAGVSAGADTKFTECVNDALLSVTTNSEIRLAGISATTDDLNSFLKCVNNGDANKKSFEFSVKGGKNDIYVGGITCGGKVTECVNNANISYDGTSTNNIYIAGIATSPLIATKNVNKGSITLGKDTATTYAIYMGGISSLATNDIKAQVQITNNVNYGALTANGKASTVNCGGIIARSAMTSDDGGGIISGNINNGAISGTNQSATRAGGIIGSSTAYMDMSSCINNASITIAPNEKTIRVGGIIGFYSGTSSGTQYYIKDCINLGAITNNDTATTSSAGGIIGSIETDNLNVDNCINDGVITGASNTGGINIGGIIGRIKGNTTLNSSLNYGAVSGGSVAKSGGIVGAINSGAVNINGALNFGAVSGATATRGGIVGSGTRSETSHDTLSYPDDTIETDPLKNFKYDSPNTPLNGAKKITQPQLVWSEYPFSTTKDGVSAYHSDKITASGCWALTTKEGRRNGAYVGDNYNKASVELVSKLGDDVGLSVTTPLLARLANLKQITQSRDTYLNYYNGDVLNDIILVDNTNQANPIDLPKAAYFYDDAENTHTITTTLTPDYFKNNRATTINGKNIELKDPTILDRMFSLNSKTLKVNNTAFTFVESFSFDYATIGANKYLPIAEYKTTVYQGEWKVEPTPVDKNSQAWKDWKTWKARYTTDYIFSIHYYDPVQSFTLSETGSNEFFLEQRPEKVEIGVTESPQTPTPTTTNLFSSVAGSNPTDATYKFVETENGTAITANWVYARFTAIFDVSGISEENLKDPKFLTTQLFKKNVNSGVYSLASIDENSCKNIATETLDFKSTKIPGQPAPYVVGKFKIVVTITDRLTLKELPSGDYKIVITLPIKTVINTRSFEFTKGESGDVFLHDVATGNTAQSTQLLLKLADIENHAKEVVPPANKELTFNQDVSLGTSTTGATTNKTTYNFTFTHVLARAGGTIGEFYGCIPLMSQAGFLPFYAEKLTHSPHAQLPNGKVPTPSLKIIRQANGNLLSFEYSFSITAQNGNVGNYLHKFQYDGAPTPTNTQNLTPDAGKLNEFTCPKTSGITLDNVYTFPNLVTNVVSPALAITLYKTNVLYSPDGVVEAKSIGYYDTVFHPTDYANSLKMTLPKSSKDGNKMSWSFARTTTGGVYTFMPEFKYAPTMTSAESPNNTRLYSYVNGAETELGKLDELELLPFIGESYKITKVASRNAYLHNMTFTTNIPSSGDFFTYNASDALTTISSFTPPTTAPSTVDLVYNAYYKDPNTNAYFTNKPFLIKVKFPNIGLEGADCSTVITFKLNGSANYDTGGSLHGKTQYNDEDTQIYPMTKNAAGEWVEGNNPYPKNTVYKLGSDNQQLVDASGNKIIDYQTVEIPLLESTLKKIVVRAGNASYYNVYELFSEGPVRNKTFNVNVKSATNISTAGMNFIPSIHRVYTDSATQKTKIARTTSFLYRIPGTGTTNDKYDAVLNTEQTYYSKTYTNNLNDSGDYLISLSCNISGYSVKLSVSAVDPLNNGKVTTDPAKPGMFKITSDEAFAININIEIVKTSEPPWGDHVFT